MTQMDDVANWAISTEVRTFYERARTEFQNAKSTDRCAVGYKTHQKKAIRGETNRIYETNNDKNG